jgi:DNA repair photolyase
MECITNKFYQSPRWSSEALYCPNPFTFDQYSNCSHKCAYCFAQYQRLLIRGEGRDHYKKTIAKHVDINKVKRLFENKRETEYSEYIRLGKTLQWGGMSDPFCHFEKKYGIGLELLNFFRKIDYPIIFATKGTWWLDNKKYVELFKNNKKWDVRITITTLDKNTSLKLEKGVSSPIKRLKAIEKLSKMNIGNIILRIRPFIFGITDKCYLDLIQLGKDYGAKTVSLGFYCFDFRATKKNQDTINQLSAINQSEFYKMFTSNKGSPLRLNRNIKREYVYRAKKKCDELGLKFSVGDRHFKELATPKFKNNKKNNTRYCLGQFANALKICKQKNIVKWDDIEWDMKHFENVKYGLFNEKCETRAMYHGFTVKDFMYFLWNNPDHSLSPYKIFEGIMIPDRLDKNNNIVYTYNKERE